MTEKTPLEELIEFIPQATDKGLCPTEVDYIQYAVEMASNNGDNKNILLKSHARYLGNLAENHPHYRKNPEAQKILRKVAGFIEEL